jgi:hypothetical protein
MRLTLLAIFVACAPAKPAPAPVTPAPAPVTPVVAPAAPRVAPPVTRPHDPPRFVTSATTIDAIATTFAPDGALYVVGSFFDKLDLGGRKLNSRGGSWRDAFVARIRDGSVEWLVPLSDGTDVSAVAAGSDGVVVAGTSEYTVGRNGVPHSRPAHGTIASYDTAGKLRWQRQHGASGLAIAPDGTVYASNGFAGTVAFDATTVTSTPGRFNRKSSSVDSVVMRLAAATGAIEWVATGGGGDDDVAQAVTVLPSGDVAAAGIVGVAPRFGTIALAGAPASRKIANPQRGFCAIYDPVHGTLRRAVQLGWGDWMNVDAIAAAGTGVVVRGWQQSLANNDRRGFVARLTGDDVNIGDSDADDAVLALDGDAAIVLRTAQDVLMFSRVTPTTATTLATLPHHAPAIAVSGLAVAADGRYAVTGSIGSGDDGRGFVAVVSDLADLAALR